MAPQDLPRIGDHLLGADTHCEHCRAMQQSTQFHLPHADTTRLALHLWTVHKQDWQTAQAKARAMLATRSERDWHSFAHERRNMVAYDYNGKGA